MRCEQRAKDLLDAWVCGDSGRMRAVVDGPEAPLTNLAADEEERMELLDGIAARLTVRRPGVDAPEAAVSIRLLRHLAASRN